MVNEIVPLPHIYIIKYITHSQKPEGDEPQISQSDPTKPKNK